MLTTEKLGKRLSAILVIGLLTIAILFVTNNYQSSKNQLEDSILGRLHSIAVTTALQIDGDIHAQITDKYGEKESLQNPLEDSLARDVYQLIRNVKANNNLNTDIYTLFYIDPFCEKERAFQSL